MDMGENMEKGKRACIYCRVGDYRNDHLILPMMKELRSYCAAEGLEVVMEYGDCGSGTTLRREGLKAMMAQAACKAFDVLVIKKHSMLSRSMEDLAHIIDQLDEYGIEVRSTIGNSQITHEHIDQLRAIFNNPIVKEFKLKE